MRTFIIALLASIGFLALAAPAQSADRESLKAPCATPAITASIMAQRVSELGELGKSRWLVQDMSVSHPKLAGVIAGKDLVWIAETAPCAFVRGLVDHEWMHLQQDRRYSGHAEAAFGGMDTVEAVADCGAQQLGNPYYTPYLRNRGFGCTEYENSSARSLIELKGK